MSFEKGKCCLNFLKSYFGVKLQVLLRGPNNAREAVKHFGPAPGVPHSHIGCMCAQRKGSMRGLEEEGNWLWGSMWRLEEEGTTRDLGFKMTLVFDCEASLSFVTANQILLDFRFHRQLFICLCLLHVIGLFNYQFENQSFLCYKIGCV